MPIHFTDRDVVSDIEGIGSVLIVPCIMCPAATVSVREGKPFIQIFKSLFKSPPLERYIKKLQSQLADKEVRTEVFRSRLYHHWFMCMWTTGRREKLRNCIGQYDAVIVLGCDSATETVREAAKTTGREVIEGMKVSGIMNARLKFQLPGNVSFSGCKTVPISGHQHHAGLDQ